MTDKRKESAEYIAMRDLALKQLRSGKSLTGEGGVFAPIIKEFLENALSAEMESHLDEQERSFGNKRNGKGSKTIKTSSGQVTIETPQDRHSSFEPQIIKKRETILADNLAPQIIGLYGKGMSLRDISSHIKEMYDVEVSAMTLSEITDRVIPLVKEWQNRPLEEVYQLFGWMPCTTKFGTEVRLFPGQFIISWPLTQKAEKNSSGCIYQKAKGLISGYQF